jgi:hypothetical protein
LIKPSDCIAAYIVVGPTNLNPSFNSSFDMATDSGEALNTFALAEAKRQGATTVDLTSRPSRKAAERLYQRLGFEQRHTNVYRYKI